MIPYAPSGVLLMPVRQIVNAHVGRQVGDLIQRVLIRIHGLDLHADTLAGLESQRFVRNNHPTVEMRGNRLCHRVALLKRAARHHNPIIDPAGRDINRNEAGLWGESPEPDRDIGVLDYTRE